jgi:hypothetical protein
MATTPIQLLIELDPTAEPITGTLQKQPHGSTEHFHGWLQLTETLQAIRHAQPPPTGERRPDATARPPRTDRPPSPDPGRR